jgi:hypothetical protein
MGMVGVPVLLGWGSPAALSRPMPNETVEKGQFSYFLKKVPFENQWLLSEDFQVLGFFDSLNPNVQAFR